MYTKFVSFINQVLFIGKCMLAAFIVVILVAFAILFIASVLIPLLG